MTVRYTHSSEEERVRAVESLPKARLQRTATPSQTEQKNISRHQEADDPERRDAADPGRLEAEHRTAQPATDSFVVACTLLVLTWLNMRDMGQLPRRRRR